MQKKLQDEARAVQSAGRFGDTELVHLTPNEKAVVDALFGPATTNPQTGLDEHFIGDIVAYHDDQRAAHKARDEEKRRRDQMLGMLESQFERIDTGEGWINGWGAGTSPYNDIVELYSERGSAEIRRGYEAARGELMQAANASRQQALMRSQQGAAQSQADLDQRGLGNTGVGQDVQRGAESDMRRQLQEVDAQYAGQMADLQLGETQAGLANTDKHAGAILSKEGALQRNEAARIGVWEGYSPSYLLNGHLLNSFYSGLTGYWNNLIAQSGKGGSGGGESGGLGMKFGGSRDFSQDPAGSSQQYRSDDFGSRGGGFGSSFGGRRSWY